jgi:acetylornithine deacetylase
MTAPRPATLDLVRRLIAFDTTSRLSNLDLIRFVADYLDGLGIRSKLVHDETGRKANLWATIGPDGAGGVVLSGHTDVVPVDGQPWDSDPFKVIERDGRLYGRGTSDMKSFIAVALAFAAEMKQAKLREPIHFAFSYDEEVGCLGVHGLVDYLKANDIRPRLGVIGEPTEMRVVDSHKGGRSYLTTVTGLEQHSSARHRGVNAIEIAAELIGFLMDVQRDYETRSSPVARRFDPPYSTIQVGTIEGGTANNIVARCCTFGWEQRSLPGADPEEAEKRLQRYVATEVLPRMRHVHPGASVEIRVRSAVPPLAPEAGSPAEVLVKSLVGSNATEAVSYATEAGIFQAAGIPVVVCGPGNIREAHKPNEWIELEQIAACEGFMARLIGRLSA